MAQIIRFPKAEAPRPATPSPEAPGFILESKEEDEAFFVLLKEWPCFSLLEPETGLEDVLELYYEDQLNPSQDAVVEFIFHMHDPKSPFDIAQALYTWDEEDRHFFTLSIHMHAELIQLIKKEQEPQ